MRARHWRTRRATQIGGAVKSAWRSAHCAMRKTKRSTNHVGGGGVGTTYTSEACIRFDLQEARIGKTTGSVNQAHIDAAESAHRECQKQENHGVEALHA